MDDITTVKARSVGVFGRRTNGCRENEAYAMIHAVDQEGREFEIYVGVKQAEKLRIGLANIVNEQGGTEG